MLMPDSSYDPRRTMHYMAGTVRTVVGVDLGFQHDPTAIAVVEEREEAVVEEGERWATAWEKRVLVRHLERLPTKTLYEDVLERVKEVADMLQTPRPRAVVVDATGVGLALAQRLRSIGMKTMVSEVILTGGDVPRREVDTWRVPKRDVLVHMQLLLEQKRLKLAPGLLDGPKFVDELQNMRVKVSASGNEQFGCWRQGTHDDLVLAVGMGAWWLGRKV